MFGQRLPPATRRGNAAITPRQKGGVPQDPETLAGCGAFLAFSLRQKDFFMTHPVPVYIDGELASEELIATLRVLVGCPPPDLWIT